MADTITGGSSTITPATIDGYEAARQGQTLLHWIVGRTNGSPDVTLRPANLRAGTLRLVFMASVASTYEADAAAAAALLATAITFTLTSTSRPTANMTFVVPQGGQIDLELDDETRAAYVLTVPFQEYL